MALIARDRLGNVHQVNSLLIVQENAKDGEAEESQARTSAGIQIILSKSPLDSQDVGYEKPKPKGLTLVAGRRKYNAHFNLISVRLTFQSSS